MTEPIDYTAEYNNSARVAGADEIINHYIVDAAVYREDEETICDLDLSYGPEMRNQLDIFWPNEERDAPIVVFIHGGYWQRLDRTAFSHLAQGLVSRGVAVALPSYTLCPDTTIEGIINEMRRACILLFQTYKRSLTVTGHSAGGHLAACMLATDWPSIHPSLPFDMVTSGMGLSGIYELEPLIHTPINVALGLNSTTAQASSPVEWMPEGLQQFEAWVGGDESDEFHRQSQTLAERWSMIGTPTYYRSLDGLNHFTVVQDLTNPESAMVKRILELVNTPVAEGLVADPDEDAVQAEIAALAAEGDSHDRLEDEPNQQHDTHEQEADLSKQV